MATLEDRKAPEEITFAARLSGTAEKIGLAPSGAITLFAVATAALGAAYADPLSGAAIAGLSVAMAALAVGSLRRRSR